MAILPVIADMYTAIQTIKTHELTQIKNDNIHI